jgi:maltose-binding protein MalE
MLTEMWEYVIVFSKIVIHKVNKELYGVIFLFIYMIYSYSFVEGVGKNCDKKEWKQFW